MQSGQQELKEGVWRANFFPRATLRKATPSLQSSFWGESILFSDGHQSLVRFGESKVLDQTRQTVQLWRVKDRK